MWTSDQLEFWGTSTSLPDLRPAKTSAPLITPAEASTERAADSFSSSPESSPSSDRRGSSLRMFLALELEAQTGCSPSWNRRATPAGRSWWVLTMSAPPTDETECGLLPTALSVSDGRGVNRGRAPNGKRGMELPEILLGPLPTPTATDAEKHRTNPSQFRRNSPGLFAQLLGELPTPTAQSYGSNRGGAADRVGEIRPSLRTMLSPTARGNLNSPSMDKWAGARALRATMEGHGATGTAALARIYGWMMGYPPGWLDDR